MQSDDDSEAEEEEDTEALPRDPFWDAKRDVIKHVTGIMKGFRPVELFDNSANSPLGILRTLKEMLSDEWLGPQVTHANMYILLNGDIAIFNRIMHLIHTTERWELDEELQALVDDPDGDAKLAARLQRMRERLHELKDILDPPRTAARLAEDINAVLADDTVEGEEPPTVSLSSLSRIMSGRYFYEGPLLRRLERYCTLCAMEDAEPDDDAGDASHAAGAGAWPGGEAPAATDLVRLRQHMTNNLLSLGDTMHPVAHYIKVVYKQYRNVLYKPACKAAFKRGRALGNPKLVQIRYVNAVLRLVYTPELCHKVQEWHDSVLVKTGKADPRAELLLTFFELHLPLAALWELALLHGDVHDLRKMLPHLFLARGWAWHCFACAL